MLDQARTPEPDPIFRLFTEISIIAQLAQTRFGAAMPEGMTAAQFTVLNHLVRLGGGKTPADLARAFQVSKGTMTSTLGRLLGKGLVAIVPDRRDGRSKRVDVTADGRALRDACIAAIGPDLRRWSLAFDAEELDDLLGRLARLRMLLDRDRDLGRD